MLSPLIVRGHSGVAAKSAKTQLLLWSLWHDSRSSARGTTSSRRIINEQQVRKESIVVFTNQQAKEATHELN